MPRPSRLILLRAKLAVTEVLYDVLTSGHGTQAEVSSRSTCIPSKLHDILNEKLCGVTYSAFMTVRLTLKQSGFFTSKQYSLFFSRISNFKFKKVPPTFRRTQFWTHSRGRTRQTGRPIITNHHQHLIIMITIIKLHSTRHEYKSHWCLYSRKQVEEVFCGHVIGSDRGEGHIQFKTI